MNHLPISLSCNSEQFQYIYNNLSLYGSTDHEDIAIETKQDHFYPKTAPKKSAFFSQRDVEISAYTLDFFEKNPLHIARLSSPHTFILKFKPLFKGNKVLKSRFCDLQQEIFKLHAEVATEAISAKMLQETERSCMEKIQNTENRCKNLFQETEIKVQEKEKNLQQNLADYQSKLDALEKKLLEVTRNLQVVEDTLLVCKNGSIPCQMVFLEKICFFKSSQTHAKTLEKTSLSETEAKLYKYKYEFKNCVSQTLFSLIEWLKDPQSINKIAGFGALSELYELADFLNDDKFSQECLAQFKTQLNTEGYLEILAHAKYEVSDPLIQHCCEKIQQEHLQLIEHRKLGDIQAAYFFEIAKQLKKPESYKVILAWAKAQSQQNNTSVKNILYQEFNERQLVKYLNLRSKSAHEFLTQILPKKVLSTADALIWLKFYLNNFIEHNTPIFHVYRIDDLQAKIYWNIPVNTLFEAKDPNSDATCSTKFYLGTTQFDLFVGKQENPTKFVIGACAYQKDKKFDSIIKVQKLRFASDKPEENRTDHWDNDEQSNHIVYFSDKEIQDNLDIKKCSLPIKVKLILPQPTPTQVESSEEDSAIDGDETEEESSEAE